MVNGRPLFPGSLVEDQLKLIFSLLGTPPKDCWPNLDIPYKFPKYERGPLNHEVPRLDATAIHLLEEFLQVSMISIDNLSNATNEKLIACYVFLPDSMMLERGSPLLMPCGIHISTISV